MARSCKMCNLKYNSHSSIYRYLNHQIHLFTMPFYSSASSLIKADDTVNAGLDSKLERKAIWTTKFSVSSYAQNALNTAKLSLPSPQKSHLPMVKRSIVKSIKQEVCETWTNRLKSQTQQGQFISIYEREQGDPTWKSYIFNLPRGVTKFLMNSTLDTLPTNSNLLKWGKRSNVHCELCHGKGTLLHTLNNCPTMLKQGRYTWRHNSVLKLIASMLVTHINQTNWKVFANLPKMTCSANGTIPQDII